MKYDFGEFESSKFSSPMGYLYFYSKIKKTKNQLQFEFSSPMGYLYFYSARKPMVTRTITTFSSPMGYLYFYSERMMTYEKFIECSRPLWGIYISILVKNVETTFYFRSRPLWGIYISIQFNIL